MQDYLIFLRPASHCDSDRDPEIFLAKGFDSETVAESACKSLVCSEFGASVDDIQTDAIARIPSDAGAEVCVNSPANFGIVYA